MFIFYIMIVNKNSFESKKIEILKNKAQYLQNYLLDSTKRSDQIKKTNMDIKNRINLLSEKQPNIRSK
jgi:hypothetical protein